MVCFRTKLENSRDMLQQTRQAGQRLMVFGNECCME